MTFRKSLAAFVMFIMVAALMVACGDSNTVSVSNTTAAPAATTAAGGGTTATTAAVATTAAGGGTTATTAAGGGSTTAAGEVAPYSGFKPISLGALEKTFTDSLASSGGDAAKNISSKFYTVSEAPDKAIAYYKGEADKRSYTVLNEQEVPTVKGKVTVYGKQSGLGSGEVLSVFYFTLDATTAAAIPTSKAGDTIFIISQGGVNK